MTDKVRSFQDEAVEEVFDAYPANRRADLLRLRQLIFTTAESLPRVRDLRETLKWGQPAYLPVRPRIGSTVRIDILRNDPAS
jgi:hypothetical protein